MEIEIARIVKATPAEVFESWTKPEILYRWWGPRSGADPPWSRRTRRRLSKIISPTR
jgi:uncharacterized protein YndB with AHSA1/START domain